MEQPIVSPDGAYIWDGQQWIPNPEFNFFDWNQVEVPEMVNLPQIGVSSPTISPEESYDPLPTITLDSTLKTEQPSNVISPPLTENDVDQSEESEVDILKIVSKILPSSIMLTQTGIAAMNHCIAEFILMISSEAGIYATAGIPARDGPPVVLGSDIVCSLQALGFSSYALIAKEYLHQFQSQQNLIKAIIHDQNQSMAQTEAADAANTKSK